PTAALVESVRAVRFDAVCLSVTAPASLPTARLACATLAGLRLPLRLYLGGRALLGAREGEADTIAAIRLGGSLRDAADLVGAQLRAARAGTSS
ncbi:MAG: hypothetical protein AB7G21_09235, partial [Dehalococcoidia bacterium]